MHDNSQFFHQIIVTTGEVVKIVINAELSAYLSVNYDSLTNFWLYKNKLIENQ